LQTPYLYSLNTARMKNRFQLNTAKRFFVFNVRLIGDVLSKKHLLSKKIQNMKNKIVFPITTLLVTWSLGLFVPLLAQSDYKLQSFEEISVTGNIEVTLEKGDEEKAVVETFGIPEDELNIGVRENVLKLSLLNSIFYKNAKIKITVYYKTLHTIRANAGAKIEATQIIESDALELRAGSGAQVTLELKVNTLEGTAAEGGILKLTGETNSQKAQAYTGGQYRAFDLICKETYVRAGTGGEAKVVANETLDANANLGGSVEYKGDPNERNRRTTLGGDVKKVNF